MVCTIITKDSPNMTTTRLTAPDWRVTRMHLSKKKIQIKNWHATPVCMTCLNIKRGYVSIREPGEDSQIKCGNANAFFKCIGTPSIHLLDLNF